MKTIRVSKRVRLPAHLLGYKEGGGGKRIPFYSTQSKLSILKRKRQDIVPVNLEKSESKS